VSNSNNWREKATSPPEVGFRTVRSINGITGGGGTGGIAIVPCGAGPKGDVRIPSSACACAGRGKNKPRIMVKKNALTLMFRAIGVYLKE
jgi:hypothetical protein